MDAVKSFLLIMFALAFSITMGILVMINGWGIQPVSYGWIIGIGTVTGIVTQIIVEVAKK